MTRSIRIFLAFIFGAVGLAFLLGTGQTVDLFEQIGLGQWLRYGTGLLAVWGAILLTIPSRAILGSAIATAVSLGAMLIEAFTAIGTPVLTIVLAFFSGFSLVQAQLDAPIRTRRHGHAA